MGPVSYLFYFFHSTFLFLVFLFPVFAFPSSELFLIFFFPSIVFPSNISIFFPIVSNTLNQIFYHSIYMIFLLYIFLVILLYKTLYNFLFLSVLTFFLYFSSNFLIKSLTFPKFSFSFQVSSSVVYFFHHTKYPFFSLNFFLFSIFSTLYSSFLLITTRKDCSFLWSST